LIENLHRQPLIFTYQRQEAILPIFDVILVPDR
jgi:hypothetical protein